MSRPVPTPHEIDMARLGLRAGYDKVPANVRSEEIDQVSAPVSAPTSAPTPAPAPAPVPAPEPEPVKEERTSEPSSQDRERGSYRTREVRGHRASVDNNK